MKPISFTGQTIILGENQEGVEPLPARYENGFMMSVWELTEQDIEDLKKDSKIIVILRTNGQPMQAIDLATSLHSQREYNKQNEKG